MICTRAFVLIQGDLAEVPNLKHLETGKENTSISIDLE